MRLLERDTQVMPWNSDLDAQRDELRKGTRLIFRQLGDPWGHVAVRLPESYGKQGFMLKHVRVPPPPADPSAVMVFDEDGNILEGERAIPWEIPLYVHIFRARSDVQSVIHTHPHVATALTMAGKTVFAITHQSAQFEHGIPVFQGDMINTPELGLDLAKTLDRWPAALLKGHGAVAVGLSVGHAVQNTLYLEQAARQQMWAATVGTPEILEQRHIDFHKRLPRGEGGLALWYTHVHYDQEAGGHDDLDDGHGTVGMTPATVHDVGV
jgi:ribulose-5-phosphate 4-epimerase/fuculose-1-phosphate aldolase